jgi:hypothetical protein
MSHKMALFSLFGLFGSCNTNGLFKPWAKILMASERMSYAKAGCHHLNPDVKRLSAFVAMRLKNKVIQNIKF